MLAVVVTGPPGAGKTAVGNLVHDALGEDGVANALVEIDHLERAYPPLGRDRAIHNLGLMCAAMREAGHDIVIVTVTLEDEAYAAAVREAIAADDYFLVRLEADANTMAARVLEREPATWSGRDALIAASRALAETMPGLPGVDLVLSTEGRQAEDVAAEVRVAVEARRASAR